MQQGNLKLHFPRFLCLIYFGARKGDFLPFPFGLHLLQFLYIGLMIRFILFSPNLLMSGHRPLFQKLRDTDSILSSLFSFFSSCCRLTLPGLSSHPGCKAPGTFSAIIHSFCAQIPTFLICHFNLFPT